MNPSREDVVSYWKGLLVAAALDVVLIAGSVTVAPVTPVAPQPEGHGC